VILDSTLSINSALDGERSIDLKVIVSAGAKFWAHRAAQVLEREGALVRWITGSSDHKGYVSPDLVQYVPVPAYVGYAVQRAIPGPVGQFAAYAVGDNLFDLLARRYVSDCDILHVYNHHGLFSMRKAARLGAKTVVERASAHILTQHALMREEFEMHGQRFPYADWPIERKHIQEYAEADHIVVCSEFVKRTMIERGISAEKMTVVYLGVDLSHFTPQPKQDDVFRVVFVGSLSFQKGTHYLLEAFSRLDVPNKELLLVGAIFPGIKPVLKQYEGQFKHVPGVPQEQLVAYYNSASVFAIPSVQDGFPMAAIEAMACGVPAIISENVGTPLEQGKQGFIVPIRDAGAILQKLVYLYEHEDERREMGRQAVEFAHRFSWARYQDELYAVYRRLS
jgi:glycosyltransferase involved in cell wall biosynthesis